MSVADPPEHVEILGLLQRWLSAAGGKWCLPILDRLADGPARYNDLLAALGTVAPKVLTQTLRRLEGEGFVRSQPTGRRRVMYCLTDRGAELRVHIGPLRRWTAQQLMSADVRPGVTAGRFPAGTSSLWSRRGGT